VGDPVGGWLGLTGADGLPAGDAGTDGEPDPGPADTEAGGCPLVAGAPVGTLAVPPGDALEALGCGLAESDGPAEAEAAAEACGEAGPDGVVVTVADGVAVSRCGNVACRAGSGAVDTPGCRIGAIGGCFGRGRGVRPETQA
jgi:hypothetical protein